MEEMYEKMLKYHKMGEYGMYLKLSDELDNIRRLNNQRNVFRSIRESSQSERKENNNLKPYLFITVNPDPSRTNFEKLKKATEKMVEKKWLKSYVYVYEQRGCTEDEAGIKPHMHAIIKKPDNKSVVHCVRELASSFKKLCDVSDVHFFNVKYCDEAEKNRKLEYILGEKVSTEENRKDVKQSMDKIWRERINIEPFYFLDIDIGKYATKVSQVSEESS